MGHLYDVPFVAVIGPGSIAVSLLRASDFSAAPESLAPASSADAYYPLVKSEVQTFTYRLPSAGEYTIGIGILSNWDTNNTSAILVDNVHASIPEPETLPLLGLGLAAFLSIRSLPCAGSRGSLKADKPGNVSEEVQRPGAPESILGDQPIATPEQDVLALHPQKGRPTMQIENLVNRACRCAGKLLTALL